MSSLKNYIENMLLNIADELNVKEVIIEKDGLEATYKYDTIKGEGIGFEGESWMFGSLIFSGDVIDDMQFVRQVVREGLNQRSGQGVKVRQPLQSIRIKARY